MKEQFINGINDKAMKSEMIKELAAIENTFNHFIQVCRGAKKKKKKKKQKERKEQFSHFIQVCRGANRSAKKKKKKKKKTTRKKEREQFMKHQIDSELPKGSDDEIKRATYIVTIRPFNLKTYTLS